MRERVRGKWKQVMLAVLLLFVAAGFLFVAYLLEYGPVKIIRYLILLGTVFYLACIDYKSQIVPNRVLLCLVAVRVVLLAAEAVLYPAYLSSFLWFCISGATLAMAILFVSNILCKRGMGLGDIKLFGVIGCYVGPEAVLAVLFFSLVFAACFGAVMMIRKKLGAKDEMPFVPFVFAGLAVASLLGI